MNHKKLLLTLTLCLCALLCMVVTASASEVQNTGSHSHELCKKTVCTNPEHIKSGTHGSVTFATELRQDGNTLYIGADEWEYDRGWGGYILPAGTYYLGTDLTLDHRIQIQNSGGEVTLCLNGNTITCTSAGAVIQTPTGSFSAKFTLCDCQPNGNVGKITHAAEATGSGVDLQRTVNTPAHTFIMYNGCITGNTSTSGGGGVYVADSTTFTMYGGSIVDNKANPGMYASNGGGVYVAGGDTENKYFTMYGGSITGNHTAGDGGGIYSTSNNISIYGGSVTGNSAERNGGAVYVAGTMIVGGDINISGNWKGDAQSSASNNNANNVYLSEYGNNGSIDGPATIAIEEPLTGTGSIGITTKTSVATTRNASVKIAAGKGTHAITDVDKGHFTPDTGYCEVQKKDDGALYLTHVHSGGEATCNAGARCTGCNREYGAPDSTKHSWKDPTYVWNDLECTAKRVCARNSEHVEEETKRATQREVTQNRTCTQDELATFVVTFTNTAFAEQTKENVKTANMTGHAFAAAWEHNDDKHWHKCTRDGCTGKDAEAAHEWQPATYTAPKTCVCGATQGEPLTRSYYYYAPSAAEDKKDSPKAGDPGVLLYAGLALASLTGLACTAKKRH